MHWAGDGSVGWAVEIAEDPQRRTLMLHWARADAANAYLYELIQISDCGRFRARIGQWIEDGRVKMRTLIDEQKVEGA